MDEMVKLPGVKLSSAMAYYYSGDDMKMITVPIGQCQGDLNLHPEELKKYFGVEPDRMGTLPQYLITPHLDSTKNNSRSSSTGRAWWDITGEVIVYQPLEWVPIVHDLGTITASAYEKEFEKKTTTIEISQIYGDDEMSFKVRAGFSWKAMKLEDSNTTTVEVSYGINQEVHKEIVERGEHGELLIKKVALGMGLKVDRVFEHGINLYFSDDEQSDSVNWDGPESWDALRVPASAMRDVSALQFHPIRMLGGGYSNLWLQVLPVFNTNRTLTDMHVAFSTAGMGYWYAYLHGSRVVNGGRVETIALPDNKPPLVTFILQTPTNPNPYCPTHIDEKALLPGVKQNSAGEYYYTDYDLKSITIPIGECQGAFNLSPEELKKHFGVDRDQMGLPRYLIASRLDYMLNHSRSGPNQNGLITRPFWFDVTGDVIVYQPLEWVPIVVDLGTIQPITFKNDFEKNKTLIDAREIYKSFNALMFTNDGSERVIRNTNTSSSYLQYLYLTHCISMEDKEIVEKGKHGLLLIKKVALVMALKVKRVFEHGIKLYLSSEKRSDSLTWDGPESWNDIMVASSAVRIVEPSFRLFPLDAKHLDFGRNLQMLALPVFNTNQTVTDLHLVLGNEWRDWYVYRHGSKVVNSGKVETIGLPNNKFNQIAFIPLHN